MSLLVRVNTELAEAYLLSLSPRLLKSTADSLNQLSQIAKTTMWIEAPERTGYLRSSIGITRKGPLEYEIGPTAPYAIFVERGTRPHIIRPKTAQVLHFFVDGEEVFTREVHHPGTRANPFVARTRRYINSIAGGMITRGIQVAVS